MNRYFLFIPYFFSVVLAFPESNYVFRGKFKLRATKPVAVDKSEPPVIMAIGVLSIVKEGIRIITFYPERKEYMNAKYYKDDDLLVLKLSKKPFIRLRRKPRL